MSQTPLTQLCEINPAQPKGRHMRDIERDDIAPVAVFLASDESRWVTGDTLAVSGGLG